MRREYDDIVELEILEYLSENKDNNSITRDFLIKNVFSHHSQSMMNRIVGNLAASIGASPYKITALGEKRLEFLLKIKNSEALQNKEKWKFFRAGVASSAIIGLIVGILPIILTNTQQPNQEKYIVIPRDYKIHDTVYISDKK